MDMAANLQTLDMDMCRNVAATCPAMNLRKVARRVSAAYERRFVVNGLSSPQFFLLVAVAVAGSPPITRLAKVLDLDQTTLSRTLRPLQRRDAVRINRGADRRTRTVSLSPSGVTLLSAALKSWKAAQTEFLHRFGKSEWREFLGQINTLHHLYPL
jgi:DNA-binding MarR family transcriptional regulator